MYIDGKINPETIEGGDQCAAFVLCRAAVEIENV